MQLILASQICGCNIKIFVGCKFDIKQLNYGSDGLAVQWKRTMIFFKKNMIDDMQHENLKQKVTGTLEIPLFSFSL